MLLSYVQQYCNRFDIVGQGQKQTHMQVKDAHQSLINTHTWQKSSMEISRKELSVAVDEKTQPKIAVF